METNATTDHADHCCCHHASGPARRPRRRRTTALLVAAAVGLLAATAGTTSAVWAAGAFSDVPADHAFAADISWMATQGISTGHSDGTYRPGDAVTRGSMAAFLRRYSNETEVVVKSAPVTADDDWVVTVTCPQGKRAIAGGGATSTTNAFITDSKPQGANWIVRWESDNGVAQSLTASAYATCVPGTA